MIFIKRHTRNCVLAAFLAAVLTFSAASCGGGGDAATPSSASSSVKAGKTVVLGVPGNGVGRIMPDLPKVSSTITIYIDPGHGFMDGGSGEIIDENGNAKRLLPNGLLEKDITLAISKKVQEYLTEYGFTANLTHDGEIRPPAAQYDDIFNANERVAFANGKTMDYFISIHSDAVADTSVCGSKIYYWDNSVKINKIGGQVAESIVEAIHENLPEDPITEAVDQGENPSGSFAVVREIKYPSALIEAGFATNESDAKKLADDEWQSKFAKGIADGIYNYFIAQADEG